jgi:DNA-directed RNA polymerase subunit M/transcription elongation factor TFIIS
LRSQPENIYLNANLMGTLGPAAESLRLAEHYRRLSDDELIELAQDASELTELAQGALKQEILERKLKVPAKEPERPQPEPQFSESEDEYAEDRSLVELCTVWSRNDALKVQELLSAVDIPFFMGPERATTVDKITSRFSDGVPVGVMQIGFPWAHEAIRNYVPKDAPPEPNDDAEDADIRCPKCHSTDVVFEHLSDDSKDGKSSTSQRFDWTCASCGHSWEDDGVESNG